MPKKIKIDPSWLRQQYFDKKLSTYAIAKIVGCSAVTIADHLKKQGPIRSPGEKNPRPDITKQILEQKYIQEKKSLIDISKELNCYDSTILNKLKKFKITSRSIQEANSLPKVVEQRKKTNLERCGVEHPLQCKEVQEKQKQTNLERYGAENPSQNKDVQKKTRQTNLERYGSEYIGQVKEFKIKARNTKIKSGVITLVEGRTLREWAKDGSLASTTALYKSYKHGIMPWDTKSRISMLEIKMKQLLDEMNVPHRYNLKLPEHQGMKSGFRRPDFLLTDHNLIIECDGEYWHQDEEKDEKRNNIYAELGYDVICFSGQEIMDEWSEIRNYITNLIVSAPA